MKVTVKGFSLIELMIVVAIIGILSAIAVPAYRNYSNKAKFSELLSLGGGLTTRVSEYLASRGVTVIGANTCAGIPNPGSGAGPLTSITDHWNILDSCVVTVDGITNVFGGVVTVATLTPTMASDGSITWTCTSGSQFAPSSCP